MLILVDAIKITLRKVLLTIFNIAVFRNVFAAVKYYGVDGFWGFLLTIYLSGKVNGYIVKLVNSFILKFLPQFANKPFAFDESRLKIVELTNDDKFNANNLESDLFNSIFTHITNNSILSLFTIILIEYVHSNYEIIIVYSIVYCVSGITFILFGSSFVYTKLVDDYWSINESTVTKKDKIYSVAYSQEDGGVNEHVCIWSMSGKNENEKHLVNLKYLTPKFKPFFMQIFDRSIKYASLANNNARPLPIEHQPLDETNNPDLGKLVETFKKKITLNLMEFYFGGFAEKNNFSKTGFKAQESWVSFILFPAIETKETSYIYDSVDDKNK